MTRPYDLHILSLSARAESSPAGEGVPGVWAATQARGANRHRQEDTLVLFYQQEGSLALIPEKQKQLLEQLGKAYYKTPGTVSGAMRMVAESLNHFLVERNSRGGEGNSVAGHLTQVVLRGDRLYLAQSGLTQAIWVSAEGATLLFDPDLSGKGLGFNRTASVRYYQTQCKPGDTLLLSLQPPASWQLSLLPGLLGQGPQSWRRKLTSSAEGSEAVLMQIQGGAGKVIYLPLTQAPAVKPEPSPAPPPMTAPPKSPLSQPLEAQPEFAPEQPETAPVATGEVESPQAVSAAEGEEEPKVEIEAYPGQPSPAETTVAPQPQTEEPKFTTVVRTSSPPPSKPGKEHTLGQSLQKKAGEMAAGIQRLLPDESLFQLPTPIMALIAVVVPLLVVTLASLVYFREGRMGEYERYLLQARQVAQAVQGQKDPLAQREGWQLVLANVERAETYASTTETQELRAQALVALDHLDTIVRLDFMPAVQGDLPKDAQITRMIATQDELFMLDAVSGVVWRARAAARGYVVQPNASCGPGVDGANISKLVGFTVEKRVNQLQAVIIGADANGVVITCQVDKPPQLQNMKPADTGMGALTGFTADRGNYYTLDTQKNAVWVYWAGKFDKPPELFFSLDIPKNMLAVVDFAIYQDDLYLLYDDGHLVQCTYNATTPTRCSDPQSYKDGRPGRENQPMQPEHPFTRVFASQLPEPALYFLDPVTPSIFQFSLRSLTFHAQYRQSPLPTYVNLPRDQSATALAVSNDHSLAFIAYNDQVYYAVIP